MRVGRGAILLAAATVFVGGCASPPAEPRAVDFGYQGKQGPEDLPPDAPCIWVKDERSREAFYGMKVTSEQAMNWMSNGIANTLNARTSPTDVEVPEKGLLISLTKAYINPIDTTLSGVVVIKVTWGERVSTYRGQIVQTNWWGADSEIGRTMSAALDKALLQINFPTTTSTCVAPAA